jgi:hypothetical protein
MLKNWKYTLEVTLNEGKMTAFVSHANKVFEIELPITKMSEAKTPKTIEANPAEYMAADFEHV